MTYRLQLWGKKDPICFKFNVLELEIHTSLEMLSKYLYEMNVLNIGCFSKKHTLKRIGWIYLNLKRYFVNNILCGFSQSTSVVEDRVGKKKIGEVEVELSMRILDKPLTMQETPINQASIR